MLTPEPHPTNVVCKACGLDWSRHTAAKKAVTLETCVRLLKADLAARPKQYWNIQSTGTGFQSPGFQL